MSGLKFTLSEVTSFLPDNLSELKAIDVYHWRNFRSTYRKLVWVGFEPTTTEFRSDAVPNWAIIPWVQPALRANFVYIYNKPNLT